MTPLETGLAVALAGLGLLLLLCCVLAWRVLRRLRDNHEDMGALAHNLRSQATLLNRTAGETLDTFNFVRKEMLRLMESARSHPAPGADETAPSGLLPAIATPLNWPPAWTARRPATAAARRCPPNPRRPARRCARCPSNWPKPKPTASSCAASSTRSRTT